MTNLEYLVVYSLQFLTIGKITLQLHNIYSFNFHLIPFSAMNPQLMKVKVKLC